MAYTKKLFGAMLYNYLKVILRNFISDGMYTFIIIFGLAVGLASILVEVSTSISN